MIKGYNLVGFHYFNSLVKFKDQDKVATFRNGFTVYTNDLKKNWNWSILQQFKRINVYDFDWIAR